MGKAANDVENSNIQYNFLWSIEENKKRTTTDIAYLVIYGMCVVAWIGIAIYIYNYGSFSTSELMSLLKEFVWEGLFFNPVIYFYTFFCILLIVFYFITLRWCTKFAVYLTIILEFLFITLALIAIGFANSTIVIPLAMFCYFIFWIEIQILRKADVHMLCKIIVDACKASVAFPASLLIGLLAILSIILLTVFIATVIYCLYSAAYRVKYHELLDIIFLICTGWIVTVHISCMLFVLHGTYTSLYRMTKKSIFPRFTIVIRHLFYAYRYHIGSFAYMGLPFVLMIQVIRTVCANIHMLKMKVKESPYNIYCFLVIIGNIVSNTSIVCASYGKCLYPSMKDAFKVLIQNSMIFTATRLVITRMIFFGLSLIPGITMCLVLIMDIANWSLVSHHLLVATGIVSSIITTGVLFTFSASLDSVLFCHLEELLNNKESADEGYEIN